MERARAARVAQFPVAVLQRPLDDGQRAVVSRQLRGLLAWQHSLRRWPLLRGAPDATPFVSVYAAGRLIGCVGSAEGEPAERVARAFLLAMADPRRTAMNSRRPARSARTGHLSRRAAPDRAGRGRPRAGARHPRPRLRRRRRAALSFASRRGARRRARCRPAPRGVGGQGRPDPGRARRRLTLFVFRRVDLRGQPPGERCQRRARRVIGRLAA